MTAISLRVGWLTRAARALQATFRFVLRWIRGPRHDAIQTLGHNLAVVGALHRAFILGIYLADGYAPDGSEGPLWRPNLEGRSAL